VDQWYVARGQVTKGPYSLAQVRSAAANGFLRATDLLRQEGTQQWIAAEKVSGLFPRQVAAAAPALPDAPANRTSRLPPGALAWMMAGALVAEAVLAVVFLGRSLLQRGTETASVSSSATRSGPSPGPALTPGTTSRPGLPPAIQA
jgi:GYF domain 2